MTCSPSKTAVLLINLGSPDSTSVRDVRRYLREFLSDPRVLDAPWPVRQFVLNFCILPFRPRASAEAYEKIWTAEGSPLVVTSRRVQKRLAEKLGQPVELAMRYGRPSISEVLQRLADQRVEEIHLIPLYPHYAMSSYETVVERVREVLHRSHPGMTLKVQPPFFDDPDYLEALVTSATPFLERGFDHLLFSFHGLPERHLRLADTSGTHCLARADCCETPHSAHKVCYRAQALHATREFVRRAGIAEGRWSVSFQSRLGREPWLKPYTDLELQALPARGVRRLTVICPAFVSDCLETLEEIGMRGRELFLQAGGKEFTLIPCLNDHLRWIEALARLAHRLQD